MLAIAPGCSDSSGVGDNEDAGPDASSDTATQQPGDTVGASDTDMDIDTDTDVDTDTDMDVDTDTGPVADPLVVQIVEPGDNSSFLVSDSITFTCSARFQSGAAAVSPAYAWSVQPAGLTLFGQTVTTAIPAGTHTVTCSVSDAATGATASAQVSITVGNALVRIVRPDDGSRIPEEYAGAGASESIEFRAVGEGANGQDGSYAWQIGAIANLLGQQVQTALPVGTHTIVVTFTDPSGNSASDQIQVEVVSAAEWAGCIASEEVCNGIDDNCNEQVDEGRISCGIGECERTVTRCTNGVDNVCVPGTPSLEQCNGRDDDCDGLTDEHDGDPTALCDGDRDRVCMDGDCERFEYPLDSGCTQCPCDFCEDELDRELCCEIPGIGTGVICINQDRDERCPMI